MRYIYKGKSILFFEAKGEEYRLEPDGEYKLPNCKQVDRLIKNGLLEKVQEEVDTTKSPATKEAVKAKDKKEADTETVEKDKPADSEATNTKEEKGGSKK